jgi:hypothetical protein
MAQGARQSSLFAAEDFSVVYESFAQANFQAYDFETIKAAMVEYVNTNYPENYNDWITSSEFVSLIELMAFLGHNLAFRADLASRENYLSTAERRDSVLRIADFLGYTPTRNVVASGYLKIDTVRTTEPLYDVNGVSLQNTDVQFEDVNDPDTYQNFLTIMNSIFQSSSQFGSPYAKYTFNNIQNEIYRTKSVDNDVTYSFSSNVNGSKAAFNLHSVYYNQETGVIEERRPEPFAPLDILYRNDNSGNTSPDTGFFVGLKQGNLEYKDFVIDNPLPNMVIDIDQNNIANGNVWVQTIDEIGQIQKNWTRIDRLFGTNAIFNAANNNVRDIFTVTSRTDDQISIVFGDGNFGNIPRGIVRVWYRVGLNQTYSLEPVSFGVINYTFNYVGTDGNTYRSTINCSLKSSINNASRNETVASIKANAGRFFATQDRMVTADDYSLYPLTVSENIQKIKSVNRVHSGHSRFRDFHDPTATYSDASMYTDDGYLYKDDTVTRKLINLPTNLNGEQVYQRFLRPLLNHPEVKNFYYDRQYYGPDQIYDDRYEYSDTTENLTFYTSDGSSTDVYRWNQVTKGNESCSGYVTYNSVIQRLGESAISVMRKLEENALAEFIASPYKDGYISNIEIIDGGSGYITAPTITVDGVGTGAQLTATIDITGTVTGVTIVDSGMNYGTATNLIFTSVSGTGARARVTVKNAERSWTRIVRLYSDGLGEDDATGSPKGTDPTGRGAVILDKIVPSAARIKRIVPAWEIELVDSIKRDVISLIENRNSFGLRYDPVPQRWKIVATADLPSNTVALNDPSSWSRIHEGDETETGLDNSWIIRVNYTPNYWEILTRKTMFVFGSETKIRFNNLNFGETFSSETLKPLRDHIKVLSINTSSYSDSTPLGVEYKFNVVGYFTYEDGYTDPYKMRVALADPDNSGYPTDPTAFQTISTVEEVSLGETVVDGYTYLVIDSNGTETKDGRNGLHIKYNRISDLSQVIDPSTTNIIDTYVLTKSYDAKFRTWMKYDGRSYTKPAHPTIYELRNMFGSLESKKSISDQIVYRPVRFRILFGEMAGEDVQARFIVTKTTNATMSDTEIKQKVISLIESYFDIDNWDFGETFYFTEMAAYVHNNMIGQVAQITLEPINMSIPKNSLFEIRIDSDEMFIPSLKSSDIVVNDNILYNPTSIAANTGVNAI